MNVQENTSNTQDAAKQIWETLDAEDSGTKAPPEPVASNSTFVEEANPAANAAPAIKADAHAKVSEEDAPTAREQALLDKIAGLESTFGQVQQRLRTAEGHIGGLNNQLKQARQPAGQAAQGDAPTAQQMQQARTDPEAMKALKKDYPEFATAMSAVLDERMSEIERRVAESQPRQSATQPVATPEDLIQLRNSLVIESKHEGWEETVRRPEFGGWLQRQPREVQMLSASADPRDAIRLLDLHATANKPASQQTDQRLTQAAAIPTGRHATSVRQKSTDQMTDKEFWAYQDELDRNKAKG